MHLQNCGLIGPGQGSAKRWVQPNSHLRAVDHPLSRGRPRLLPNDGCRVFWTIPTVTTVIGSL